MELVIYFKSLVDETNKGYFLRMRKTGFSSVNNVDRARKFKSQKDVNIILDKLKNMERKYYKFEVWEVLSNGRNKKIRMEKTT